MRDGDVFEICGRRFKFEASVAAPSAKRARADDDDEDDVMEVAPPPARPLPPPPSATGDDDEEVQITQHQGALTDFPHSREHCTTFPIAADAPNGE